MVKNRDYGLGIRNQIPLIPIQIGKVDFAMLRIV